MPDLATASSKSLGLRVEICRWQENYGITDVLLQTEEPLFCYTSYYCTFFSTVSSRKGEAKGWMFVL